MRLFSFSIVERTKSPLEALLFCAHNLAPLKAPSWLCRLFCEGTCQGKRGLYVLRSYAPLSLSDVSRANSEPISGILSIEEYRRLLHDEVSTDEQIRRRIDYLESLSRDIIRAELKAYVQGKRKNSKDR